MVNRLLLPFGLHHIPNALLWFQFGTYKDAHGDLNRFFAGDPHAGGFMTGFFPIMMFALPAACLAMIHTARPDRRKAVAGILGAAALTSFLTGVTEPIEFAFVFVAPALFVVHAVLTGTAMLLTNALAHPGGLHLLRWLHRLGAQLPRQRRREAVADHPGRPRATRSIYYVVFRFMIVKFNLKTPGREPEGEDGSNSMLALIIDQPMGRDPGRRAVTEEPVGVEPEPSPAVEAEPALVPEQRSAADDAVDPADDEGAKTSE